MKFKLSSAVAAIALATGSLAAHAGIAISGGELVVANTGHVSVTFLGSDAGYTNVLVFDPFGANQTLFTGHSTAVGTTIDLGTFSSGTQLTFKLFVTNTGNNFFTGPASANADGVLHAQASLDASNSAVVGFEDIYGGGDHDYNDLQFKVSNVAAVPEPETYAMLLAGLGLMGAVARRQRKSQAAA